MSPNAKYQLERIKDRLSPTRLAAIARPLRKKNGVEDVQLKAAWKPDEDILAGCSSHPHDSDQRDNTLTGTPALRPKPASARPLQVQTVFETSGSNHGSRDSRGSSDSSGDVQKDLERRMHQYFGDTMNYVQQGKYFLAIGSLNGMLEILAAVGAYQSGETNI